MRVVRIAVVIALSASCTACVCDEYDAARTARDEYANCRHEHPADPALCAGEQARYDAELGRFEDAAREAWNCDPDAPDRCERH